MSYLPESIFSFIKKNQFESWILISLCAVFILLRLPSLSEPNWYGDEGIYQVVGMALNAGRDLYSQVWDNKPPLLYIIYAFSNSNLFIVKLLSLISGLGALVSFYFLARKLFKNIVSIIVSTGIFSVLFGLPILEGNIANAENFMLFPILMAANIIISRKIDYKNIIMAGLLLSIAFTTKIVAVFDFAAFFLYLTLTNRVTEKFVKTLFVFFVAFLSLILICGLYFLLSGSFNAFLSGVFLQNVSYVSEQYGAVNPELILFIKTVLLIAVMSTLLLLRRKLPKTILFIFLWTAFAVYSALFSDRPYTHYLLMLLPSFSLLCGQVFEHTKFRIISIVLIVGIYILGFYHVGLYRKNFNYYTNYVQFLAGARDLKAYQSFFDSNTPRDYDIASFINNNTNATESVFLWSDSAQIYALSKKIPIGKYVVAYHITSYDKNVYITRDEIERSKPKYIIQTSLEPLVKELLYSYRLRYIMEGTRIYEREI